MILRYDPEMRPVCNGTMFDHVTVGQSCPICGRDVFSMIGPVKEQADGSATGRCSRCRAPLRMNTHGFVFVDQEVT